MKITVGLMRDLEKQVMREEISYSRMVEILNETAAKTPYQLDELLGGENESQLSDSDFDNAKRKLFNTKMISLPDLGGDVFKTQEVMRFINRVEEILHDKNKQIRDLDYLMAMTDNFSNCECGEKYPSKYYASDSEGCELCPMCLRQAQAEATSALRKELEELHREYELIKGQNDLYVSALKRTNNWPPEL